ncbi:MAG: hypothetical protein AB7G06_02240 [Bdellovibrionales bacterium]
MNVQTTQLDGPSSELVKKGGRSHLFKANLAFMCANLVAVAGGIATQNWLIVGGGVAGLLNNACVFYSRRKGLSDEEVEAWIRRGAMFATAQGVLNLGAGLGVFGGGINLGALGLGVFGTAGSAIFWRKPRPPEDAPKSIMLQFPNAIAQAVKARSLAPLKNWRSENELISALGSSVTQLSMKPLAKWWHHIDPPKVAGTLYYPSGASPFAAVFDSGGDVNKLITMLAMGVLFTGGNILTAMSDLSRGKTRKQVVLEQQTPS